MNKIVLIALSLAYCITVQMSSGSDGSQPLQQNERTVSFVGISGLKTFCCKNALWALPCLAGFYLGFRCMGFQAHDTFSIKFADAQKFLGCLDSEDRALWTEKAALCAYYSKALYRTGAFCSVAAIVTSYAGLGRYLEEPKPWYRYLDHVLRTTDFKKLAHDNRLPLKFCLSGLAGFGVGYVADAWLKNQLV